MLKLLARYEPLIEHHLQYVMNNPGSVFYFSPQIENEFISLLFAAIKHRILSCINGNKYYGIMVDSTPRAAHKEQLSYVIRFVDIDFNKKEVCVQDCFLCFMKLQGKDPASRETTILD